MSEPIALNNLSDNSKQLSILTILLICFTIFFNIYPLPNIYFGKTISKSILTLLILYTCYIVFNQIIMLDIKSDDLEINSYTKNNLICSYLYLFILCTLIILTLKF